jgi:hypothetical protein
MTLMDTTAVRVMEVMNTEAAMDMLLDRIRI